MNYESIVNRIFGDVNGMRSSSEFTRCWKDGFCAGNATWKVNRWTWWESQMGWPSNSHMKTSFVSN